MDPRQPVPIPDHEWDAPSTLAALRDRDAGALIRLARKYGASQHYLAGRAMYVTNESLTQNQISLIASGKARVEKLEVWQRIAAALDMPDRARVRLGLAPREYPEGRVPTGNCLSEDIERMRRALAEALESGTLSEASLDDWEQTALTYGRATRHTAPARLLQGLLTDFGDLEEQLRARQPGRLQRRLCRVSAQFSGMVSLALTNLGQYESALRWGRTARLAADESGDRAMIAWVRAQDAYAVFYEGESYMVAVDIARQAQDLSGKTPSVGAALAAALEARAQSLLGDHAATTAAIARAEQILTRLDAESVAPSAFGYNEAQLRFHEGNALTHLGRVHEAWTAQQRALELYPATDTLDRTLVHLDRAMSLVRSGEVDAGASYGVQKLLELAPSRRTDLIKLRATQLAQAVDNHRKLTAVRDLRAILSEAHRPQGPVCQDR